jgi:hypothetical protein
MELTSLLKSVSGFKTQIIYPKANYKCPRQLNNSYLPTLTLMSGFCPLAPGCSHSVSVASQTKGEQGSLRQCLGQLVLENTNKPLHLPDTQGSLATGSEPLALIWH